MTPEDARRQFDEIARKFIGISGDEFIRRYDAGEFAHIPDDEEHRNLIEVAMLVNVGR